MKTEQIDPFPRRPAVNISFSDVIYTAITWNKFKPEKKTILHGVSGEFRSGELTAIMGPSGAGKSTLLNILAGFTVRGSRGTIMVNGEVRKERQGIEEFKKVSCYIQQDDVVRPLLTVREAMALATHLKLGCHITLKQKEHKIFELLEMLGLTETANTFCGHLSGGQKKRLSMALELVTNPPVIFLDEPTTGLDCVSTSSCVALMRQLAEQGRTMVCTMHQPSAMLFSQFSNLYCVAEGRSIYQGPPSEMTNFLSDFGLRCPPYHNPADFIIEVACGEYSIDLRTMERAARDKGRITSVNVNTQDKDYNLYSLSSSKKKTGISDSDFGAVNSCLSHRTSFWIQLFHLYNRNLMVFRRDHLQILLRLVAHLIIGVLFGYLYRGVGNNAQTLLANFIYVYGTNLFLHYTGQMTVLLSFPLEYKVLTREHFNRWYTLAPYCVALLLVELPFQVACAMTYIFPSYYLTEQPVELSRFGSFVMFNIAISLTAQATGFLTGALLPITLAVFLGPVITCFFSVFGFTSKYTDITAPMRPFYNISYFRSAFQGSFLSLYGNGRLDLPCSELYCHFKKPDKFLHEMDFSGFRPLPELCYILLIGAVAYLFTLIVVWHRLNRR